MTTTETIEESNPDTILNEAFAASQARIDCGSEKAARSLRQRLNRARQRQVKKFEADGHGPREKAPYWSLTLRTEGGEVVIDNHYDNPYRIELIYED